MIDQILLVVAAFIANAFSAFAGGGAGLLQLPLLIFLGLPFAAALATHKLATVFLGIGATLRHAREHNLEKRFIITMLLAGVPGVVIGANLVLFVPGRLAEIALGVLTMSLGIYSVFKPALGQKASPQHRDRAGLIFGGLVLFIIGILNGSLTSGTGLFVTLWLVHWFGLDYKQAVAHTLVLVGLFWNGSGALALGLHGIIYWAWLPALIVGALLGGYIGAHWSIMKGNRWIKRAYELVTFLVGVLLLLGRARLFG